MTKKSKWLKEPSVCPQCGESIERKDILLSAHFYQAHGRSPTPGEKSQFRIYRKTGTPYSDTDFAKPRNEVSGGGVSPK